ncbi:pantetheine-phosphate adenylyltransferase [Pediococcus ethanolidurans]|uniref:pantetheine-phosphate adenylyltransferase n=1 Tax=Pediococcus ethanolidurans TaxID=319653 RepID=UPI001C1EA901|nr:pantetheine-phosphate adenylyltransferase [Pediococcus ethanolidurans]MBU7563298.1 pantetheine-phosphate adenylyltransferase [Pediococcus ethanolidurans]MCV3320748.1 pantetheine-phosphate adenylyltransferase [Pediococcus ethanolidurans]MCV3322945.1 pantetheine-phosphate adenylyltransferase [Pediococcus ethanolidurans]MCV3328051.1 pantetheine-phosphate adenylyltransferase [Pediococcus ethanolidurans]MCV3554446.1 pantetheine-phosphate adenylyltransferase [Pediococcus ethanolidurans]
MKIAVFPGSFDPLTNGHLNIIKRASRLFDELVIAVAVNTSKSALFSSEEKVQLIDEAVKDLTNVRVITVQGLTVDLFKELKATTLVRGLRDEEDYRYERQIAEMNHQLENSVETVFLMARPQDTYVASSIIKEIAKMHGDISKFVPQNVVQPLTDKFK